MTDLDTSEEIVRPRRHRRRRRRRSRFGSFVAVFLSLVVVGGLIGGIYYGGSALLNSINGVFGDAEDYPGPGSGEVSVTIEEGASIRSMGATLFEAGVVASQDAFIEAADGNPQATSIQPGNYVLAREMRASDAVEALISGEGGQRVSLPEGYRVRQTVTRLAEESGFTEEELQAAIDAAALPEYAEGDPEGFLYPATYDLGGDTTPESLVAAMLDRFDRTAQQLGLLDGAAALNRTPLEVVTVASIVQREVSRPEDMPRVAEVIYNRLSGACQANGVPEQRLQMDSTVHYAVDDYSSVYTSPEMRQVDSPYNTYRVSGLPPGPIASPGDDALTAALNPANEGNCYFVAVNLETGETAFAVTAADHAANEELLRAYCRESDRC
ncbi:endolytic transglycosylase MltG [Jiangella gansuensis]|uniref:endolytic transglycosylase MltG n=1 Tax=Jiangella gansuensis TaxID=281473 RepID=UPI0004BBE8EE|nr:endolytic transglycosylase MltG [Jiangella gansuensis]